MKYLVNNQLPVDFKSEFAQAAVPLAEAGEAVAGVLPLVTGASNFSAYKRPLI